MVDKIEDNNQSENSHLDSKYYVDLGNTPRETTLLED